MNDRKYEEYKTRMLEEGLLTKPDTEKKGEVGTQIYGGYITGEEFNTELTDEQAIDNFDKMDRTDSQVHASLELVWLPILSAVWEIQPASQDKKHIEHADFVKANLFHNENFNWESLLRNILKYLQFGFYVFEKVWEIKENKYFLKSIGPRKPKTIQKWIQNDDGSLKEIEQMVFKPNDGYETLTIPNEYLLVFTNDQEGFNWRGKSIIRSVYGNWKMKNMEIKLDAIRHERFAIGVPMVTLPESSTEVKDKAQAIEVCETFRGHEKGYVIKPYGWGFEILDMKAKSTTDIMASIKYHDSAIMGNILGNFMELGKTASGNRALGQTLGDVFMLSEQAVAKNIQNVFNESQGGRRLIKDLVDFNFPNVDEYPKLISSKIGDVNWEVISNILEKLSRTGFLTVAEEDESFIRKNLHLPEQTEKKEIEKPKEEPKEDPEEDDEKKPAMKVAACDCGEHHLADTARRPFSALEKSINLAEIDNKLRDFEKGLIQTGDKHRQDMLNAMINKGVKLLSKNTGRDVFDKEVINFKPPGKGKMFSEISKEMRNVYDYSQKKARQELREQGIKLEEPATMVIDDPKESKKVIKSLAELAVATLTIKLHNEWRKELTRQKNLGIVDTERIRNELTRLSKNDFAREMREKVRTIFGTARDTEAVKHKDQITSVVRSEIMDEDICSECEPIDGKEFQLGDDFWRQVAGGGYINCKGGKEQCRGINVYLK